MRSCYITHTKIITIGDVLFDENIEYAESFKPIFKDSLCFSHFKSEKYINKCPRIKELGYVFLNKKNIGDVGGVNHSFLYVPNNYSDDQRLRDCYFELYKPINFIAFKDGIKSKGKIFVHFYPFGCISIIVALSLRDIKTKSKEEVQKLIIKSGINKSNQLWKYRCKWGDMPLCDMVSKIEKLVSEAVFISNDKALNWCSEWNTAYLIKEDIDCGNNRKDINSEFYVKNRVVNKEYRSRISGNKIKYRQHPFRTFWRINRIFELVLVKRHLYYLYAKFFNSEILRLRRLRIGTIKDRFSNKYWNKVTVYNSELSAFICYLDDIIKSLSSKYRYIYYDISEIYKLNEKKEHLFLLQRDWLEECNQYRNILIYIISKIIPFIKTKTNT